MINRHYLIEICIIIFFIRQIYPRFLLCTFCMKQTNHTLFFKHSFALLYHIWRIHEINNANRIF